MKNTKQAPERILFRGSVNQLSEAGDWMLLLNYVRTLRIGRILGPVVVVFLGCGASYELQRGNTSRTWIYMVLAILVALALRRKISPRDVLKQMAANRKVRAEAAASGTYAGDAPFRIELAGRECRVYFGGSAQPNQIFDCRKFRMAVECDEIVWVTGKRREGLPLPKAQLDGASPEELRRWLKPYVAIWYKCPIPEKLKQAVRE